MSKTIFLCARYFILLATAGLQGCASEKYPLCPAIAEQSVPGGKRGQIINAYIIDNANRRNVKVEMLSEYEAIFTGLSTDLRWFRENYPAMLCAFDPRQNLSNKETCMTCTKYTPLWIELIRSNHPENLMADGTKFWPSCSSLP